MSYIFLFYRHFYSSSIFPSGTGEEDAIPDVEEEIEEIEDSIKETMFTFETFEKVGRL